MSDAFNFAVSTVSLDELLGSDGLDQWPGASKMETKDLEVNSFLFNRVSDWCTWADGFRFIL